MRRAIEIIGIAAIVTTGASCIEIDGGAVELSWSLRSFDGEDVEACNDVRLAEVQICWQPAEEGTATCLRPRRKARYSWSARPSRRRERV